MKSWRALAICGLIMGAIVQTAEGAEWASYAIVSPTSTLGVGRLCYTDGIGIACDAAAPLAASVSGGFQDRITSGTTSVFAANGGPVSVTIAGANVANIGSGGMGITAINASGAVTIGGATSATTISGTIIQANTFIGDGSQLTGIAAGGTPDRIVSGTSSVFAANSGAISVTVAGSNVANIGSGGMGITNINASGAVSATGTGYFGGNVGIGTTSAQTRLDVSGTINSRGYDAGSGTSIDFSQANVVYTSAACGAFTLSGMVNGGSYSLISTGSGTGPATFIHPGLTVKTAAALTCTSAKHTVFTFLRAGANVYVSMIAGY